VPDGSNPYGSDGRQITIDQLRTDAPYIPLPNSDLANDDNVGSVWVEGDASDPDAQVYYPASGIEFQWHFGQTGSQEGPVVNGIRASLYWWYGATRHEGKHLLPLWRLDLRVLPDEMVTLTGRVPTSDLISVAKMLDTGAASPDTVLPSPNPPPGSESFAISDTGLLLHAVPAASGEAAAGSLAFQPVVPPALGVPDSILHTDPASASPSDRVLSLRYDDPSMGRFWVLERPSHPATASLIRKAAADCAAASDCTTMNAEMVDLGGGVSGLAVYYAYLNQRIDWVENGVFYRVVGSLWTFTPADALSVADVSVATKSG